MFNTEQAVRHECESEDSPGCRRLPSWKEFLDLLVATYRGWMADRAPRLGASLAFYTLLSLAPMIIVVVAIAGLAFGEKAAKGQLIWQIQDLVGWQGAVAIQGLLTSAYKPMNGWLPTAIGLVALFFGATAVVNELRDALNTIWRVPERDISYWMSFVEIVKTRVLSFAMVAGIGFLLMVSLIVSAWVAAVGAYFGALLPLNEWLLRVGYSAISVVIIGFLFALLYKFLPDVRLEWSDVAVGAGATSIMFTAGKIVLGIYLARTGVASTYGAAGSLVIVLLWVYYSAQIFFFGAEFTYVYTQQFGSIFRRNLTLHPATPENRIVLPGQSAPPENRPVDLVITESFANRDRSLV